MPGKDGLGRTPHDEDVFASARPRPGRWSLAALWLAFPAHADVGQIKVVTGQVFVDRKGQSLPGRVGLVLETDDVLRTGADGSVGITMRDNSLLSAGPNSILTWSASSSTRRPATAASTPACSAARSP